MGFLQRTADGFLDLTGQRVGGKYPTGISDSVVPVIDIRALLAGRTIASETAASLTSAVGDQAVITVPDNETWLLFGVSLEVQPALASELFEFQIYLTQLPGSSDPINKIILGAADFPAGTRANRKPSFARTFDPIALSAGCQVIGEVTDESNAGRAFAVHAGIIKLVGN